MCGFAKTKSFGGAGGTIFSDDLTETCQLIQVNIRHGSRIDGIQGVWQGLNGAVIQGVWHGGQGGTLACIKLAPGELIVRIDGRSGTRIDQLTFTTNKGNVYKYGGSGGDPFSVSDVKVGGFFGQAGAELDRIGFFTTGTC